MIDCPFNIKNMRLESLMQAHVYTHEYIRVYRRTERSHPQARAFSRRLKRARIGDGRVVTEANEVKRIRS